ncbi:MAG: M42 family metallopeptidase [Acidobacteriota bacterium]|nr:M42 family metallopeptidase [Acidobacteriota bacterium]
MELLKELCEACGPPGFEDRIRDIYRREITPLVDRVETDGLGNVIAIKNGQGPSPRKVMLAGHLDEIGFVVKFIDDDGFLRLQPLGGFDPKTLIAKRVVIRNRDGEDVLGVIGTKPIHIMTDEERKKMPELDDLFVDIGLGTDDAKAKVRIGDPVTLAQNFVEVGDYVSSKALDNRVSIYTLIEAVRRAQEPQCEIYAVATSQEEVGLRGATTAAHRIRPDVGVAIDVTLACDVPGTKPQQHVTQLREGVGIKILDSSFIAAPKLVEHCRSLAEKHSIPHQMEILPRGGTDAGGIQRAAEAVPSITLSIPTRYLHSVVETIYGPDLEATVDLLARFLETVHDVDLSY